MKRIALLLAATGVAAAGVATSATAAPSSPPPGCGVVVSKPAANTGSSEGQAHKMATFNRVCTGG